jgi:hypothetical protein
MYDTKVPSEHWMIRLIEIVKECQGETGSDLDVFLHEVCWLREGNYFFEDEDMIKELREYMESVKKVDLGYMKG